MQKTIEELQAKTPQPQHRGFYSIRILAGLLGIQGVDALISTLISLISNPLLFLSDGFLSLNVSIFVILLSWGLWTFKRWAYWVTLLVEALVLIRGIFVVVLPPGPIEMVAGAFSGAFLSLIVILYLIASPNARAIFFQKNTKQLPKDEREGLSTHLFE